MKKAESDPEQNRLMRKCADMRMRATLAFCFDFYNNPANPGVVTNNVTLEQLIDAAEKYFNGPVDKQRD